MSEGGAGKAEWGISMREKILITA